MTKAKLVILSAQHRGKVFELTKDFYSCGRLPERDICIPDTTVSSYHCEFIRSGDNYIIRDHHSTNGIRVNNVQVSEQMLSHTDLVTIGMVEALYESDDGTVTVTKANTNIDIQTGDMTKTVVCIAPTGFGTQLSKKAVGPSKKGNMLFIIIFVLLALLVASLVILVYMALPGSPASAAVLFPGLIL